MPGLRRKNSFYQAFQGHFAIPHQSAENGRSHAVAENGSDHKPPDP